MKITSLYIENFGTLHAYTLNPQNGLSVICENNGFGKTTLAAFVRAMLYGFDGGRRSLDENDRKKYLPWQGGAYGGTMTFTANEKHYRAERFFGAVSSGKSDTFVLYDLATGIKSDDFSENLGIELFGVDADGFSRSAFLGQKLYTAKPTATTADNATVTSRLNDASAANEDPGAYDRAFAALDKKRLYYKRQGGRGVIADLETLLSETEEKEAACLCAQSLCDDAMETLRARTAALSEVRKEQANCAAEKEALLQTETHRSHIAHGKTLLGECDRSRRAVTEALRFLSAGSDTVPTEAELSHAVEIAKGHRTSLLLLQKQIAETKSAHQAENARLTEALSVSLPDDATLQSIRVAVETVRLARAGLAGEMPELSEQQNADCISDEELDRHMQQAAKHASESALLASPPIAKPARDALYAQAGLDPTLPQPSERRMDLYAADLRALAIVRTQKEQAAAERADAIASLESLTAEYPSIPTETELVSVRTRYDTLADQKREIDLLEEKQRTAAEQRTAFGKRRVRCIISGIFLLTVAAVLCGLYIPLSDIRLPLIAIAPGLVGIILLFIGLFRKTEEDTRVLDDDIFKSLCEKKSAYETDKTAVSEFLDRYAADTSEDADNTVASRAVATFTALAAHSRQRETLRGTIENAESRMASADADIRTLCISLAQMRRHEKTVDDDEDADMAAIMTETEEESAFAQYRDTVRKCVAADVAAQNEAEERKRSRARVDALAHALRAYLSTLETSPAAPYHVPCAAGVGYLAELAAWKTAADTYRLRLRAKADAENACKDAETSLSALLAAPLHAMSAIAAAPDTADPIVLAQWLFDTVASHKLHITHCKDTIATYETRLSRDREALATHRTALDAFLSRFYDAPYPEDDTGIQGVVDTMATLAREQKQLQSSEDILRAFLSANALTVADLRTDTPSDDTAAVHLALNEKLQALSDNEKHLQTEIASLRIAAETHSVKAAEITAVRETLSRTQHALSDAEHRYDTVLKTLSFLKEAKTAMSTRYLGVMQNCFTRYYSILANVSVGEADEKIPALDATLTPTVSVGGVLREEGYFSRGTVDLIELCIRLALIEALYTDRNGNVTGELPPLILDDPFVNLDCAHLARARALLDEAAKRYQILYFVCHESRL